MADNPMLHDALRRGCPVIPVYINEVREKGHAWTPGAASRWWLHHGLKALSGALEAIGSKLILRNGPADKALEKLQAETGAVALYWSRTYEPAALARDKALQAHWEKQGVEVKTFNSSLLFEPWTVANKSHAPFQVFTPFWKYCLQQEEPAAPLPAPRALTPPAQWPPSEKLEPWGLLPVIRWDAGLYATWQPGESGAHAALECFQDEALSSYHTGRDVPGVIGTSRLSPFLHHGHISPRQIWHAVMDQMATQAVRGLVKGGETYLREVGWREFAYHLLYHFPHTPEQPLRSEFASFPWRNDSKMLLAWQRGNTGYPIVDAGMRELWHTGWMHNRVRMIVASFLVKDLLLPWQQGAAWFWDTLVDADVASNTLGWQWSAGCGADAAPYFRIFNPILQGKKFDPEGRYVRRWVPALAALPDAHLHAPWAAPEEALHTAGIQLGVDYPHPVVDHKVARVRALDALSRIKKN